MSQTPLPVEPARTDTVKPRSASAPSRLMDRGVLRALAIAVWLLAAALFLMLADYATMDNVTLAMLAVGVFLPAVLISLVLLLAKAMSELRAESEHLQGSIDALRRSLLQRAEADTDLPRETAQKLERLSAQAEQTETRLTMFFSQRARMGRAEQPGQQAPQALLALAGFDTQPGEALAPATLIRALHFPEDENDTEGFTALRLALADARVAPLIKAAQDVLTRLAQEGIYMDDLRPDRARPEFWRAFAQGTRGALVAPLGGIRDRSCLALSSGRMRSDPEFRAAVHLFLREFDKVLSAFEPTADDAQIAALSDTRSARAFMLLGRVSGVFAR
ncbi:MAG: Uncharacterized protein family (UPF0104) [Roseibaca calidilacus]|uniref:Uncharacterized protein family (UPF0104) n=1 Tax=Roseibaca calidilacus TaxID=1666912 RepID=A0A0P7VYG6_9RHOB|nr:hypothetical protein [Roseibaca calidilacus]KPP92431.1 MAG: Uncharacterized protein family (UPF0104) [Roseibaca calidilacus]CUX79727.1 hypothetical protein Ga0058931_0414 [Roseibaca calidilacus]